MVAQAMQAVLASLVFEGVFERFPKLRIVIMEGGLGWIPSFKARMDKNWRRGSCMRTPSPPPIDRTRATPTPTP